METYTITITPDDGSGAQTTIRAVTDGGETRITELVVRPADGESISASQLSAVDFGMLLRAIQPDPRPAAGATTAAVVVPAGRDEAVPRPAGTRGRPRPRPAPAKAAHRAQPPAAGGTARTPGPRVYRRMPDDLAEQFAAAGSVSLLAAHYGVPRYTAQGWVNRLRKQADQ